MESQLYVMESYYKVFIYFQGNLLKCRLQPRQGKQTRKTNPLKKLDIVPMEK